MNIVFCAVFILGSQRYDISGPDFFGGTALYGECVAASVVAGRRRGSCVREVCAAGVGQNRYFEAESTDFHADKGRMRIFFRKFAPEK